MNHHNVLVQPGPLRVLPGARSYTTPSFRIVDFRRGVVRAHLPPALGRPFAMVYEAEEWTATQHMLELRRRSEYTPVLYGSGFGAVLCLIYAALMPMHKSKERMGMQKGIYDVQ
ncbi:hypothetical protein V8D89_000228 [Ganoderma adspersum]